MDEAYINYESLTDRELDILRLKVKRRSNQEIADALYLSRHTIRWYVTQIYSKLHVSNRSELKDRAETLGLLNEGEIKTSTVKHNLPSQLTSFVGREHQIITVTKLLSTNRLLTLTGAGGTGKTRLALEVVEKVMGSYSDGVYFINLAPLTDPAMVANAIADVLDVVSHQDEPIVEVLKRVITSRQCILLFDNFEHVLPAAPLITDLLHAAPELRVLVTSREVLRLYGEQEFTVPPLNLLDSSLPHSYDDLTHNEAITLFVDRAQSVSWQFQLTENNALPIAKICERLDGLPLAIELAAARSKLLTPDALLKRLDYRLDTLTSGIRDMPERQRTIRNTIEWSYELLDEDEKVLFARLAVFRGGRSLEACEAVCAEGLDIDVVTGLSSLIDKNLIWQEEDRRGEPRFWMLETIHEYALECLEMSDETEIIRRQHAEFFTQLAERAEVELRRKQQQQWFQRLEIEHDNIRVALRWSLQGHDPELGTKLVYAVHEFWTLRVYQAEAYRWTRFALEYLNDLKPEHQVKLLSVAGESEWWQLNFLAAKDFTARAMEIAHNLGDKSLLARSLFYRAFITSGRPEELARLLPIDQALTYCQQARELCLDLNDLPLLALTYNGLGILQSMAEDYSSAKVSCEECVTISRQIGDERRVQVNTFNLVGITRGLGDHEQANKLAKDALLMARDSDDKFMTASTLTSFADPIGEAEFATRLLAASEAAFQAMGTVRQPGALPAFNRRVAKSREQLSQEAFAIAWEEGLTMSLDEAVAYALSTRDERDNI